MSQYVAPSFRLDAFNCPHCGAYAHQAWNRIVRLTLREAHQPFDALEGVIDGYFTRTCNRCGQPALWRGDELKYPIASTAPLPSHDMPEDVAVDFREARDVLSLSPRSSAALLRLALQKLCVHLGEKGKKLDDDIGQLVKKGLSPQVQQAMDAVRVIGNNAVHPGELDMRDNHEIALRLFSLVKLIVYEMITRPREIAEIYGTLPQGARDGIEKRDKGSQNP